MSFFSYEGVPDSVLDKQHTTSTGETYSLRHNENLKVEMSYLGKGNTNANSQGWERNSSKYFEVLYKNHPEMFSKKNVARIKDGHAPIVDQKMISSNPNWAQYRNQALVHHHIGGDGEAVAIPKNAHKGKGEIHNHEKSAGITDNCRRFSKKCASNPDSIGKTTSQLHTEIGAKSKSKSNGKAQSTPPAKISNASRTSKSSISASTRSDAVRSSVSSKGSSSNTGRSQAVRDAGSSMNTSSSPSRGDSVRNSMQSTKSGSVGPTSTQSSAGSTHSHASSSSSTSQGSSYGGGQSSGGGSSRGGNSGGSGQGK